MQVSWSKVQKFHTCTQQYSYHYLEGLRPIREDSEALQFGGAFHTVIAEVMKAYFYDPKANLQAVAWEAVAASDYEHDLDLFQVVLEFIHRWDFEKYEILADPKTSGPLVEYPITASIRLGLEFFGIVDLVARNRKTGHVEVIDWKTSNRFSDVDTLQLHGQLPVYAGYLEQVTGIAAPVQTLVQIRSTPPAQPALLKSGYLSRSAINTSWRVYREAVEAHGFDPADYAEMETKLEHYEPVRILSVFRDALTLDGFVFEFEQMAKRIQVFQPEHATRVLNSFTCDRCPFKALCYGELTGQNIDEIKEAEYEYKQAN